MKKITLFTTGLMLLLATSAFCQDIHYNYDKEADFSSSRPTNGSRSREQQIQMPSRTKTSNRRWNRS